MAQYSYQGLIVYTGNNIFVKLLVQAFSRGTLTIPLNFQIDEAQIPAMRQAMTQAGFAVTKLTRQPVPPDPEDVT